MRTKRAHIKNKRTKKEPPAPSAAGRSSKPKINAWALWIDAWRSARPGAPDPLAAGPDTRAAKELGKLLDGDAVELSRIFAAYLRDDDAFLTKQGHSLRLLPGRVAAYRGGGPAPKASGRRFGMADEQPNKFEGR